MAVGWHFENGETLTVTASHPIWSADRQDWVPLGELQEGEQTQSRDGLLQITRRIALPDMQPVYNLEIHGEHVYEVTRVGVLVHNTDCLDLLILNTMKKSGEIMSPAQIDRLAVLLKKQADGLLHALPANATSYGANALAHLRSHSDDIRKTARQRGWDIPTGAGKASTQAAMKAFIDDVVTNGAKKTGDFKGIAGAEWFKLGDAIVVRRPNGEWLSFLVHSHDSALSRLFDSL